MAHKGKNINSFAENVNKLVKNSNNVISMMNAMNESLVADQEVVNIQIDNEDIIQLPSFQNVLNRLKVVENTVEKFTSGAGKVKTIDGTTREIKVETLPSTPNKIENIVTPTTFNINPNWFFESLVFPKLIVTVDLTNQVESESDRVYTNRVIIPLSEENKKIFNEEIDNKNLSYSALIDLLTKKNISYYEDIETLYFPLKSEKYIGEFTIINDEIIDGKRHFYLDNVNYAINNEEKTFNIILKVGDILKFNNSLFEIKQINLTNNSIQVIKKIGLDTPNTGSVFTIYDNLVENKILEIPIGVNEINCIYLKGVNERYNLISNEWSDGIFFISNDLVNEYDESLLSYYQKNISDFGAEWISQAKEKRVSAYSGVKPSAPLLNVEDFKVVEINKQVNATLDKNKLNDISSQITSLKSSMSSSRNTISELKSNLSRTSNVRSRFELQNLITNEEQILSTNTSEYKSLVNELNGFVRENNIVSRTPKYRIRGFFTIPEPQYTYDKNNNITSKQEIIGFEVMYRYLKNDETSNDLGVYSYSSSDVSINATFSDWNLTTTKIKEKVYNEELDIFEWQEENVGDGNSININQLDIPITEGEKVEIKIRSISEAGYPQCPLKSDWSNSIIVSFPNNLTSVDKIKRLIEDVNSDTNSIKLDDVLNSAGFYSHITDEVLKDDNKIYHHNSNNIIFEKKTKDSSDNDTITNISVASALEEIYKKLVELEAKINK